MQTCISCHGQDGRADTGISFIVYPRNLQKSILNEKQTYLVIKKGTYHWGSKADIMPSFESVLTDKQIAALAYFIKKRFNPTAIQKVEILFEKSHKSIKYDKKMLEVGKRIYQENCILCHGKEGKGDGSFTKSKSKVILPYNFSKIILTNKQIFLYAKYGGHFFGANKITMHNWGDQYSDYELMSVTKYIDKSFRGVPDE